MKICKHNDGIGRCGISGERCAEGPCDCEELIEYEPVQHGRWERTQDGAAYCTACKRKMNPSQYGYAFCGLCGAKMDAMTFEEASRYLGKQAAETLEKLKEEGNAKG